MPSSLSLDLRGRIASAVVAGALCYWLRQAADRGPMDVEA